MAPRLSSAADREERRDKVVALALGGASVRQIARQVGVNHATVARDIHARLEAAAECPATPKYRELHRERINQLLAAWWPRAGEDHTALDRVLRLLEREAKLLGLDAPAKQEITGPDGGPVQVVRPGLSELSTADLEALRALVGSKDKDDARTVLKAA